MMPSLRRPQRGIAAVELGALLVPLLLFILVGTEGGRALAYYNTLLKGTRDASRYLSMHSRGYGHDAARCLAVYGNTTCAGLPLVPGLDTSMVEIVEAPAVGKCVAPGECYGTMDVVRVEVRGYTFRSFMLPFIPETLTEITFATLGTTMRQAVS